MSHVNHSFAAAHPAPPDQRAGRAAAGPRLRERGGERQEDADGDRARVAVTPLTNRYITGKSHGVNIHPVYLILWPQALDSVTGGAGGYKADQLVSLLAASHQAASAGSGHNGVSGHRAGGGGVSPFSGAGANTNGHTEAGAKRSPLLSHKLNGTEITAVRQLITGNWWSVIRNSQKYKTYLTGYRESAAFLLRSADELENLLSLQPKL